MVGWATKLQNTEKTSFFGIRPRDAARAGKGLKSFQRFKKLELFYISYFTTFQTRPLLIFIFSVSCQPRRHVKNPCRLGVAQPTKTLLFDASSFPRIGSSLCRGVAPARCLDAVSLFFAFFRCGMVVVRGFAITGDILQPRGALTPLPFHPSFVWFFFCVFDRPFFIQLGVLVLWFCWAACSFSFQGFPTPSAKVSQPELSLLRPPLTT